MSYSEGTNFAFQDSTTNIKPMSIHLKSVSLGVIPSKPSSENLGFRRLGFVLRLRLGRAVKVKIFTF